MIQIAANIEERIWNRFLAGEQDKQFITVAHNPSLGRILEKTFGYKSHNLVLKEGADIIGLLPVVQFRNKIISMPHFSYGGPIFSSEGHHDLDLGAIFEGKKFELRSFTKITDHVYAKKVSCMLHVKGSNEEQMMTFKSKLRQKIRKAERINYKVLHGKLELLDDYYQIYAQKMLQFGSPAIGKTFFKNLLTDYSFGDAQITVVYDENKVIAAGFSLSYLNINEVCWSTTDSDYDTHNIHALICWEILKTSIAKKYKYFSFGRSTIGSNNHRFKQQWNPIELPIFYNYSDPVGKSLKEHTYLTKIWKCQPLATSVYFGHMVSKYVY